MIPESASADAAAAAAAELEPDNDPRWARTLARFRAHRLALIGLGVLAGLVVLVVLVPLLSPYDPQRTDLDQIFQPPSSRHPMGTDGLGRDLATRIFYGGRISLLVGVLAVSVAIMIGTLVGGTAGYAGGPVDAVLMRLVDMVLSFPRLFLLILASVLLRDRFPSVVIIVGLLGALSWMTVARLVRGSFLAIKERDFVVAATAVGTRPGRIITRHLLPNAIAPIIVAASLGVATAIISESTLSFLGLGVQPPTPSWGNMLKDAQADLTTAPWTAVFPGLAIFLTVVAINFVGDGLRDALDPRHNLKDSGSGS